MEIVVRPPGTLSFEDVNLRCALGRGGIIVDKKEGDGATPVGAFPLRRVFYRSDRLALPETGLSVGALAPDDGWCDEPVDTAYNRLVKTPFDASHESLWRDDAIYDIIVQLGHNDDPVVPGRGSAIFLHVAKDDYGSTQGCVALALDDLLALLKKCDDKTVLSIVEEA